MHKCFSYPLKAENKEAFLHPGGLLGRGLQLYCPTTLLPLSSLLSPPPTHTHGPSPPRRDSLDFPSLPQPLPAAASEAPLALPHPSPHPPTSCPGRGKVCVGGRWMGRGPAGTEPAVRVVTAWLRVCQTELLRVVHVVTGLDGVRHQVNHQCPGAAGDEAVTPFIHSFTHSFIPLVSTEFPPCAGLRALVSWWDRGVPGITVKHAQVMHS